MRADGLTYTTMGLVLTQPISPTPWTRPQNLLGANSSLTIQLLKKNNSMMQVGKHTEATRKLKSKEKSNEKEITTLRDKVLWSFMSIEV